MFASTITTTAALGSSPAPNGAAAPYLATVGGVQQFVYCFDENDVRPNESWTADVTSVGSMMSGADSDDVNGRFRADVNNF
jgi:hypothetical protein